MIDRDHDFKRGDTMKVTIDTPVTVSGHIFICDTEADIEINADLKTTAGKIYILGRTVLLNANLQATSDIKVCGIEEQSEAKGLCIIGDNVFIGAAHFPASFMHGQHITGNVLSVVDISKEAVIN